MEHDQSVACQKLASKVSSYPSPRVRYESYELLLLLFDHVSLQGSIILVFRRRVLLSTRSQLYGLATLGGLTDFLLGGLSSCTVEWLKVSVPSG